MTDRIKIDKTEHCLSRNDSITPLGGVEYQTPRGPVYAVDVPGYLNLEVVREDGSSIAIMLYHPPCEGQELGAAFITQMSAENARLIGASLIELANKVDGGVAQ